MSDKNEVINRLDRIEVKIDSYAQRSTKNEADIAWLKGSTKLSVTILITLVGAAITAFLNS